MVFLQPLFSVWTKLLLNPGFQTLYLPFVALGLLGFALAFIFNLWRD